MNNHSIRLISQTRIKTMASYATQMTGMATDLSISIKTTMNRPVRTNWVLAFDNPWMRKDKQYWRGFPTRNKRSIYKQNVVDSLACGSQKIILEKPFNEHLYAELSCNSAYSRLKKKGHVSYLQWARQNQHGKIIQDSSVIHVIVKHFLHWSKNRTDKTKCQFIHLAHTRHLLSRTKQNPSMSEVQARAWKWHRVLQTILKNEIMFLASKCNLVNHSMY